MARKSSGVRTSVSVDLSSLDNEYDAIRGLTIEGIMVLAEHVKERTEQNLEKHRRTGKLGESVKIKKIDDTSVIVQVAAPHAHLVEFGHAQVTKDGRTVGHVPPYPFLRPAAEVVLNEAVSIIAAKLNSRK